MSQQLIMAMMAAGVKAFIFNDVISSNRAENYYVTQKAQAAGWDGVLPLLATVTIASGVYLTGQFNTTHTFGSYPAGCDIKLVNQGFLIGAGGNGGAGGPYNGNGVAGQPGQTALVATRALTVDNTGGVIAGGGGGGGGGNGYQDTFGAPGGGGGGGGASAGFLGSGGAGTFGGGVAGNNGNNAASYANTPGAGGAGGVVSGKTGGNGGAGGSWGNAGSAGTLGNGGTYSAGAGGAAGAAVTGNSNITWIATGTRTGTVS